jgi:hypothetical protein
MQQANLILFCFHYQPLRLTMKISFVRFVHKKVVLNQWTMFTFYVVVITNTRQIESYFAIKLNNVHNLYKNTFHHNSCFVLGDFSFNIKSDAIHPFALYCFLTWWKIN